jgi:hypothetical protein
MTDDERRDEGSTDDIEDLEAPAETQGDVAGGACGKPSMVCKTISCAKTEAYCRTKRTDDIVVYNQ